MTIRIHLPEDIADALGAGRDVSRAALESLALDGYRTERLSEEQVRRLLGFRSRFQVHEFLKQHGTYLNFSEEDLAADLESARLLQP